MKYILYVILIISLIGCTDNQRAKNFGGSETVELKGKRLVGVTWKESELWYLTRSLKSEEEPETFEFKEKSSWGIVEGTVKFVESK